MSKGCQIRKNRRKKTMTTSRRRAITTGTEIGGIEGVVVDAVGAEAVEVGDTRLPLLLHKRMQSQHKQNRPTKVLLTTRLQLLLLQLLKNQRRRISSLRTRQDEEAERVTTIEVAVEEDKVAVVAIDPRQQPLTKISQTNNLSLSLNKKEKVKTIRGKTTGRTTIKAARKKRVHVRRSMEIWLTTANQLQQMRFLKLYLLCRPKSKVSQAK